MDDADLVGGIAALLIIILVGLLPLILTGWISYKAVKSNPNRDFWELFSIKKKKRR